MDQTGLRAVTGCTVNSEWLANSSRLSIQTLLLGVTVGSYLSKMAAFVELTNPDPSTWTEVGTLGVT